MHENLLSGYFLVVALVWLFLRSVLGSMIVVVLIPRSLLVAFLGLYAMGLPANLIKGQDILMEVRSRVLQFPEVGATLTEQGRPEDGTDNEGVNISETLIRLKSRKEWRSGGQGAQVREMRESLAQIPGVRYNFSQPIKDKVEEAESGERGKAVLKVFGPDLDRMRGILEQARDALKTVPGVVDLDLYRVGSLDWTPRVDVLCFSLKWSARAFKTGVATLVRGRRSRAFFANPFSVSCTSNYRPLDSAYDSDWFPYSVCLTVLVNSAMSNLFAFGGSNAVLVARRESR